ncbi:MAG: hypothetical protein ACREHG_03660 [Candidatus Saccharimonadales bacterium]
MALAISTVYASPGPQSGSVGLTGEMPGPPPTVAATITAPTSGQSIASSPITVKGTCPANTLVEVYKNNIFAGSTTCSASGTYSVQIDLLYGSNALIARVYNSLDEPGPDSNTVTVNYSALPLQGASITPLSFATSQLMLTTNAVYRGIFPGQNLIIPISILGGTEPYAINVQWGDSSNNILSRSNNLTFNAEHTYKVPGAYQITIQGSDAQNRVAFLDVAAIVNGQASAAASVTKGKTNQLLMLWPLYTASVAILISFWLGEHREKRIVQQHTIYPHFQV